MSLADLVALYLVDLVAVDLVDISTVVLAVGFMYLPLLGSAVGLTDFVDLPTLFLGHRSIVDLPNVGLLVVDLAPVYSTDMLKDVGDTALI